MRRMPRTLHRTIALAALLPTAIASAQFPDDNFNDGTTGSQWFRETVASAPQLSVIERNGRLEGVLNNVANSIEPIAVSCYAADGWQLRTDTAFRVRVAFRQQSATNDVRSRPDGAFAGMFLQFFASETEQSPATGMRPGTGLALGTFGLSAPNPLNEPASTTREFLTFSIDEFSASQGDVAGQDESYAELTAQTSFFWNLTDEVAPSIPLQGTLYLQYLPEFDQITVGTSGYIDDPQDPNAYVISGVTGFVHFPLQLSLGVVASSGNVLSGANTWWDDFTVESGTIETAVGNLQASDGTSASGIQLTWDAPQNAATIDIYREYPGSGFPEYITTVLATETSYFDELPDPSFRGIVWNYVLYTNTGLFTENEGWAFGPPQAVTASDGDFATGVEVRWDVLPGASSYRVLRSETGSDPVLVGSPTTSPFLDTTAVAGVFYDYSVQVVKDTAVSDPSFSDSGYRGTPGPTGLVATDGTREDGILLTWNALPGASQYEIFKEFEAGSFLPIGSAETNEFLASSFSVVAGRAERFKVRALVGGQNTALSNADTGWWIPKPLFLYASDGYETGPIMVSWQGAFSPDVSYKVYRAVGTTTPTTQIATTPDSFFADETATAGQIYSYRVRGTCSLGDGPFSDVDTGQVFVPGAPTELSATDGTLLTGVRIDWVPDSAQSGIANYRIYRSNYGTYPPPVATLVGTVAGTATTFTDTTAAAGIPYGYEVRARYSSGSESTANPQDIGWRGIPVPTGLVATNGTRSDGVNLTWTAVAGVAGYRIHRAGPDGEVVVGASTTTSFLDASAPIGVTQSYRVSAVGQAGDSGLSGSATGWRNVAAPTAAAASDGSSTTTIVVEWPVVSGATGYRILRVAGTGAPTQVVAEISNPEQTSYNDVHNATGNNLVAGTLYNYAVQARCALGNSVSSPTNTGWRNVPAPGSIVASDGTLTTGVQVTWPTVAGATGYRIFRGTTAENLASIATPTASPYSDTTAVAGTTYLYAVAARTAAGDSARSGTDSGWRNVGPPTAVLATDGTLPSGVNVTWTAAAGANQYRIYRALSSAPANPVAVGTVTASPFLDVTADVGVQYAYTVRSVSASGESAPSAADNGWRTIEAPGGVLATDGTLTNAVQVTWNAVGGATGYRVYRAIGTGTPTEISPAASFTATSFTDTTAVAGTLYRYTVRTRTTLGNSLPSSPDDGWRNIPAPASIAASDGTSTAHVALSWPAVTGATGYAIYRRVGSGPFDAPINATGTTFNDTTATVGILYTYLVRAKTAAGQSAESPTDNGWRNAAAPTAVAATDGELDNGVRVTWNSVPGFGPYKVYRAIGTGTPQLLTPFGFAGSPFVDETAVPLTTYSYTVSTVTAAGDSLPSVANTGWRNIPAPTGLVATEGNPANITITWNAVAGSTGYRLYRAIGTAAPTEITPAASFTATSFTDTTAANATVYTYTVRARHALGNTLPSVADTGFKTMPAPAGVAASDGTTTEGVVVTWTPIPGVSTYRIFRALGAAAAAPVGEVPSGSQFTDTTAVTGTIYSYTVRGVFNGAQSPASTANTGWRTLPAPASIVASDGTSTANVAISWTAIPATPGQTAYRVYRQQGSAAATAIHTTPNATTTSFIDATAVAGTPYTYSVRSVMAAGESVGNPTDGGWRNVPGPATLAATDGTVTTGVNLTWPAVTGVTAYRVHRGTAPDGSDLAPIGSVSGVATFVDVTALPGVTYRYRILLTTAAGESTSTSPLDPGWRNVPAPTGFLASDGTSTSAVNLNWNAVPGASSYRLERGIGSTFTPLAETAESAYVDATAAVGTLYTYRIKARTPSGDSLATATDTGWRALPAPASIAATDGTSTVNVTVTWPSIGSAVAGHTGYRVYRGTGGSTLTPLGTVAANVTTYVDATAVGGTSYTYSVRSLTAAGESSGNPSDTGWRNVLPPANVQATDGTRTDGVNVTWTAVTGATGYRILRGTGPSDLVELATATGTAFLDATAEPGLTYHYAAKTVTAAGLSAASTPVNTGWRNVPAPAAFAAGDGTSTFLIELSWDEVEGATGYEIYRAAGTAAPTVLLATITDPSETTYEDYHSPPSNSLPAGSRFNYVVKARTPSGLSAGSPANTGWRNIPSPSYLYATEGESLTKVDLEWPSIGTNVQGHTGYRVYRRTGTAAFAVLATLPVTATTYSDLTAAVGTPYEYKVAATSAAGDSYEAPTADGWRNVPAPTGFVASDNLPDRISMNWLPVNSAAVTGYRIYVFDGFFGSLLPIGTVGPSVTVFETDEYFFGDFSVRAMTAAGESDPSNFDQGSIASPLAGMTAMVDLPDGRLSVGGGMGSEVPAGKNGDGSGAAESLDREAPEPGGDESIVDLPRPAELTCDEIAGRIAATLVALESAENESDRSLAEGLAAILESDPDDPTAAIPACEMHEGDVNLDGSVDFRDLDAFLSAWSAWDLVRGDLDRDGTIDDRDLELLGRRLVRAAVDGEAAAE